MDLTPATTTIDFDPTRLEFCLKDYYQYIYPGDLLLKWLAYSQSDYLANREFAFILRDDVHLRYLSFANAKEFRQKLHSTVPHKIDIGAVYNRPPRDRKKVGDFIPLERELVFDIDLTDYDSIRNCCRGTNVCQKCWRWMTIAVRVLERLLREHFGFTHLLWVFSGRRGIHCWVADRKARSLSNRAREAVAKYLRFEKNSPAINKSRVHPFAEHSYRTIMDSGEFDKLVVEQGWLESRQQWHSVLELCPDQSLRTTMDKEFEKLKSSELRWESLKLRFDEVERRREQVRDPKLKLPSMPDGAAKNFLRIFVLEYGYPKIDEKVTTGLNHLLKAPFSVHPKNGNVAVPLDASTVGDFKLDQVPRVDRLSAEIARIEADGQMEEEDQQENRGQLGYRNTSLAPFIDNFTAFLRGIQTA